MSINRFSVTVEAHLDGRFAVVESDIIGMWLETNTLREMFDEILRVGSRLLRTNHGLSDAQIERAVIVVSSRVEVPIGTRRTRPRLRHEDRPITALAG